MIKKVIKKYLFNQKVFTNIDAKTWIQKILLEEKYGKINS